MRLLLAALAFYILPANAKAQSDQWLLCLNSPAFVHFFHESKKSESACLRQISVTSIAFLVGGVNFGLAAVVSETGEIVEDGYHYIYLPRGTPIFVLDASLNGRTLVYIWNAHTFALMSAFVSTDRKKSFGWQPFDDRFESGQFAITIRKTEFIGASALLPADGSQTRLVLPPSEIPSGRVVRVHEVVQGDDSREMREIEHSKFSGYVDNHALRILSRPKLDVNNKYYVGRNRTRLVTEKPKRAMV